MKRKIIKQKDSYTVTLPIKWIRRLGLKPSSEVNLNEIGKKIVISAEKIPEFKTVEIDIRNKISGLIWREILGLYRKGYDEITIRNENQTPLIRKIVNELIGFEIIKQDANTVTIRDITGLEKANFESIFRRIGFILIDLTQEVYTMLQSNKINKKEITILDWNLNKFTDYCLRYLNKKSLESFEDVPIYYHLVSQLEHMGDIYKKAAFSKPNKSEIFLFEELNNIIKNFVDLITLKKEDIKEEKMISLYSSLKKIEKKIKKETVTTSYLNIILISIKDCLNLLF